MEVVNKLILPKFIESIDDAMMITYPILIDQIDSLVDLFNQNEDFLNFFTNKFENIISFIQMQINWRIAIKFLEKIIKVSILMEKFVFTSRLLVVTMKFLYDENNVYPLKIISIKTLAYLLRYCKKTEKDDIMRFLDKEIMESKNYYVRRLYFFFFEESRKILSSTSLMQFQIYDGILKFLNDNKLNQARIIGILKTFYPLIFSESRIKLLINNKIDNLKKLGNFDYEITKVK